MKNKILVLAALLGLLSACSQSIESSPTPFPPDHLPTVVALTGQAAFATADALTQSVTPTIVSTSTEPPIPLTEIPSPTPTFAAGFTDFAQIRFLTPGPASSLISPINLQMELVSGESEVVQVDLLGEDGRVLYRDLEKVTRNVKGIFRRFDLKFEIRAVSEAGYIRVSSKDDFGRLQALNTMPVLLYSVGSAQINPPGNMIYERVMVEGLKEKADFYAGEVNLKGRIWPFNDQPMIVELVLPNGSPISTRILDFNGIDTQPFETSLPYKVTEPAMARLTFRQDNPLLSVTDSELQKYIYVYSIEIMLNP
ncbi:MAG: hypothetical protein IH589_14210 [Anaerolineales bacterium]|nr:hypothetical protein [Anaerolineales bacterium]